MKLNIELYLKVDLIVAYNRNGKRNTYGYSCLLVVLRAGISKFNVQ